MNSQKSWLYAGIMLVLVWLSIPFINDWRVQLGGLFVAGTLTAKWFGLDNKGGSLS